MTPGSVLFDTEFAFQDGETGEKLFVVLGISEGVYLVAKTTTKQHGRGTEYGCQPKDRFHNFFLPKGCCYLKASTWVCLDEFYELSAAQLVKKGLNGIVKPVCTVGEHLKALQNCALASLDITNAQSAMVRASMA